MTRFRRPLAFPIRRPPRWPLVSNTPIKGGDFIPGSAVDLMFDRGRYRLNGLSVPLSTIDAYHSRASNSWGQNAQGIWQEFPAGQMEVFPGLGYDGREGHTVLNGNPLNPRAWGAGDAASASDEVGTFLGFSSAERVISSGIVGAHIAAGVSQIVSGLTYAIRVLYKAGTSGRARVVLREVNFGETRAVGAAGSIGSALTELGTWTSLQNIDHGGGIYEFQGTIACTRTSVNTVTLRVGPDSSSVGADIIVIAGQIVQRPYQVPFGVGTVAADRLVIPAADAGMAMNPSVTGVTMFWRGQDFPGAQNFPMLIDIRAETTQNRMTLYRNSSTGNIAWSFWGVSGGSDGTRTLAEVPHGVEFTALATWRPDGTRWLRIGAPNANAMGVWPIMISPLFVGIGNSAVSPAGALSNQITRRAGFLPYALSDADALALFNRINQGL